PRVHVPRRPVTWPCDVQLGTLCRPLTSGVSDVPRRTTSCLPVIRPKESCRPVKPTRQSAPTVEDKCVAVVGFFQLLMRSKPIITELMWVAVPVGVLGFAALLLWLSGNWRWVEGWIFGLWWASFVVALYLWLRFRDP